MTTDKEKAFVCKTKDLMENAEVINLSETLGQTEEGREMLERFKKAADKVTWCTCPDDKTEEAWDSAYYVPDDVNEECRKHHWRCGICNGILQIG